MIAVRRSPQQPSVRIKTTPDGLHRFECTICRVSIDRLAYGFARLVQKQHVGMSRHLTNLRNAARARRSG
jgi:hypothetical protein